MKEQIQKCLSDSKAARWTALIIVSFTMMCGYFLTDVMAPLVAHHKRKSSLFHRQHFHARR